MFVTDYRYGANMFATHDSRYLVHQIMGQTTGGIVSHDFPALHTSPPAHSKHIECFENSGCSSDQGLHRRPFWQGFRGEVETLKARPENSSSNRSWAMPYATTEEIVKEQNMILSNGGITPCSFTAGTYVSNTTVR
jgi:hypothetical protein